MLTVTEAASARLAEILKQKNVRGEVAVRFIHEGGKIRLQSDNEHPGDTTFQHEGRTVLLLDAQLSELLADETLDIEGPRLTLRGADDGQ
jgi:Fe-S cluster assembly iron-binding protein IscA